MLSPMTLLSLELCVRLLVGQPQRCSVRGTVLLQGIEAMLYVPVSFSGHVKD